MKLRRWIEIIESIRNAEYWFMISSDDFFIHWCLHCNMTSYGEPRAIDPFPKHDSHNHDHYTFFLPALNPLKKKRNTTEVYHLLEDLAVSPWVLLASNNDWLLPGPLLVDELLVLRLGSIKLGELVALVVRGDIES
jgi:hypothetical protein